MTLSEFIKKRLDELGMKRSNLINDYDLAWSTLSNIDHNKPINKVTQEKLAKALQCSQGDIQKCLAEMPSPFRKEATKPEGMAGIGITAKKVKIKKDEVDKLMREKPYVTAPDPEEPAEVFAQKTEADEEPFPVYHSVYEEDKQEGEERYKQKLRDMCLRIFSSGIPGVHTMEKIYADIGYAIVKELAQGGDTE